MLDDGEMLEVFKKSKELGAIAQVHAENGHVIDQVREYVISLEFRPMELSVLSAKIPHKSVCNVHLGAMPENRSCSLPELLHH